jgi:signal recognition particle GTPase
MNEASSRAGKAIAAATYSGLPIRFMGCSDGWRNTLHLAGLGL